MKKSDLLNDKVFQSAPDDMELAIDALGIHRMRRVRIGKTERTGDKLVLIMCNK